MENNNYKYYPNIKDEDFQKKIFEKKEFYSKRTIPYEKDFSNYDDLKIYRDMICSGELKPYTHQAFLSNFINPNTPYKGILIFHGVGTGKTASAISIAENFKDQVLKYNTKIHILVPGPLIKKSWKNDIMKFTNKKYYDNIINQKGIIIDKENIDKELWKINSQFYKLMSNRSFYKKVLGEKIKILNTVKKKGRKTEKVIREVPIDRLETLDNTILIVDEAHNFTGNEYGLALKTLISKSTNLKVILLTATPMKNLASNIIELLNFIRPKDDQIRKDLIFNSPSYGYLLDIKELGLDYFIKKINGYVSFYRGSNPLLFAKQVDMGEVPEELKFTKLIRCKMLDFQLKYYLKIKANIEDTLEKGSESVSNFVIPILDDNNNIIAAHSLDGLTKVHDQLQNKNEILLNKINKKFMNNDIKNISEIMYYNNNKNNLAGNIFKIPYLKNFSIKFYTAFNNINKTFDGKNGAQTIFIYSNLVKTGVDIMEQILIQNGYLEYEISGNYNIKEKTIDYFTGKTYTNFLTTEKYRKFKPATFLKITGQSDENLAEYIDIKKDIIDNVYNNVNNSDGKNLKIILGSKVMMEGITLENTGEIHILDAHYNLGRIYQVIGRGIRQCKHYNVTNENNPYPEVKVYRYVVSIDNGLSNEELLYQKAEYKYTLIKKVERILKENAIDCAINHVGNIFPMEVNKYKNCEIPDFNKKQDNKKLCPVLCDFMNCSYMCNDKVLNLKYYNKDSNLYKLLQKEELDYSTFTIEFASAEIENIKSLIKNLYKIKYVYIIDEIINKVKEQLLDNDKYMFDDFLVYQALNKLIPLTENDFNNYNDIIYDKFNRIGYLIYVNKYYIYQPFDLNEYTPIYYRLKYNLKFSSNIGISNLLKIDPDYIKYKNQDKKEIKKIIYDFDSIQYYYDNRDEYNYVGIIDQTSSTKDTKIKDIFKLRPKKEKGLDKKRGTGIPSLKGAVCATSKDKNELIKIYKNIIVNGYNPKKQTNKNRENICNNIKRKLLYLEKYSIGKERKTYMIIPFNHPIYEFPYNLEDRIIYYNQQLDKNLNTKIKFKIKKSNDGIFEDYRDKIYIKYDISFVDNKFKKDIIENLGFKLKNNK